MSIKILVPTDLSDSSLPAFELAIALAEPLDAVLEVVHVVETDRLTSIMPPSAADPDKQRQAMLEQADTALRELMAARGEAAAVLNLHVRLGIAWEEIVTQARADQVDMIVMSTHGRSGLRHMLLGSVTEQVVRRAPCPVMTVRSSWPLRSDAADGELTASQARAVDPLIRPPKRILVPADLSEASLPALVQAARLAERVHADLYVLHVIDIAYATMPLLSGETDTGTVQQRMMLKAGDALRTFLQGHADALGTRLLESPSLLRMGEAPREIQLAAEEVWADLIVLGRHGYRGVRRWLMGSVAEQVLRIAPCPVLVMPAPEETEGGVARS
jgi:nucleotide-binding universal stress UspA family protein